MKKLGLICLALIIALGSTGASYAAWSQNFNTSGTVSLGSFDVVFDSFTVPPTLGNQTSFSATKTDNHNYTISLVNLYPGCDALFTFVLKDTGSVPAKISAIKINNGPTNPLNITLDGNSQTDITVSVLDISSGTAIGAGSTVTGHLLVHTWKSTLNGGPDSHDAAPSSSGSFTFEVDTVQNPAQ